MYNLLPAQDDAKLFFKMEGETAERHGAIGYLRADFGKSNCEFWASWFDIQPNLKSVSFKTELDDIIDSLRDDGNNPPFANRKNLKSFCCSSPGKDLFERGNGYIIRTLNYSYYFRFRPSPNDYDIYCFVYDNRFLLPELSGKHEMPDFCYSVIPSTGELIKIAFGENGYYCSEQSTPDRNTNRLIANENNALLNVTRAQEEAMFAGSLFGWEVPAAKPWKYDERGKL